MLKFEFIKPMNYLWLTIGLLFLLAPAAASGQSAGAAPVETIVERRPNVKAYLDYLKQELTVTDERSSQREVNAAYIRHNFNRVSALRAFALKMARETDNDYIPEMEAVTQKEFRILFPDDPPAVSELKPGEVYNFSYRFLGSARSAETFYIFARLDPYEEERMRRAAVKSAETKQPAAAPPENNAANLPQKTSEPTGSRDAPSPKAEKPPARDLFMTAEDKKKEVFLKKNP